MPPVNTVSSFLCFCSILVSKSLSWYIGTGISGSGLQNGKKTSWLVPISTHFHSGCTLPFIIPFQCYLWGRELDHGRNKCQAASCKTRWRSLSYVLSTKVCWCFPYYNYVLIFRKLHFCNLAVFLNTTVPFIYVGTILKPLENFNAFRHNVAMWSVPYYNNDFFLNYSFASLAIITENFCLSVSCSKQSVEC